MFAGRISARSRACRPNVQDLRRLDPPTSETGDTHLCFGRLAVLSPTKSTHLIPSHPSTFPLHPRTCPSSGMRSPPMGDSHVGGRFVLVRGSSEVGKALREQSGSNWHYNENCPRA